jgi:DNA-binding PadR family transcriptional regulator
MYRDNTLIPSEAVRLLALGLLAGRPMSYAELAREVRHFTGRIMGPSLDLVGAPLEVLKVEGLVANRGGAGGESGDPQSDDPESDDPERDERELVVTPEGRAELLRLLSANVRPQISDLNKLIIALKMRFLHLMEPADQRVQAELLHDISERELARLIDLREHHGLEGGYLHDWLDLEIAQSRARLAWTTKLRDSLA